MNAVQKRLHNNCINAIQVNAMRVNRKKLITERTSENTDQATSLFYYSLFSELIDKAKVKSKQTQPFSTKIQKPVTKTY